MSRYASVVTGLLSDATTTHHRVGYQSTFHASNTTADIIGTALESDTFTAPNTTNAATGCIFYANSNGQTSVYTITLQEYSGAAWVDKNTGTVSVLPRSGAYIRAMLTTPYVYTTTTANYYRYKIVRTSGSGSLFRLRRTSASATVWGLFALDNRYAAPTDGDELMIIGTDMGTTPVVVSYDGTRTIGNFGSTTASVDPTVQTQAILTDCGGFLAADTAATCQLTVKGMVSMNGGGYRMGSEGTAYPSGQTATLLFNQNGVASNYGFWGTGDTIEAVEFTVRGTAPTAYQTTVVSGVGTAANPLITGGDIGIVGDRLCFPAATAYNGTEYKYIKTKNSATSYVLSDTSGGAESALANTHYKAVNMTRNAKIGSTDTIGWFGYLNNSGNYRTNIVLRDTWFDYVGPGSTGGKDSFSMGYSSGGGVVNIKHLSGMVCTNTQRTSMYIYMKSKSDNEWNDNLFCIISSGNAVGSYTWRASNQICRRWITTDTRLGGHYQTDGYNNRFYDFLISGTNSANSGSYGGLMFMGVSGSNVWYNLSLEACRRCGISTQTSTLDTMFESAVLGSTGTNTLDMEFSVDILVTLTFRNSTFASATLQSGSTGLYTGSKIGFHRYQDTNRQHRAYYPAGEVHSTGSSLTDTTADTTFDATSLAMRLTPNSTTVPLVYAFSLPQKAGNNIIFNGKLLQTAAFNGTVLVEMFLDGSTTADASYTLSGADDTWIPFVISADYSSGTEDRNATVRLTVTGTAGYAYLDTLFNASKTTNPIGSMDLWQDGTPNEYLVSTIASSSEIAGAVWSDTSTYDAGSKAKVLKDANDNAELAAIK